MHGLWTTMLLCKDDKWACVHKRKKKDTHCAPDMLCSFVLNGLWQDWRGLPAIILPSSEDLISLIISPWWPEPKPVPAVNSTSAASLSLFLLSSLIEVLPTCISLLLILESVAWVFGGKKIAHSVVFFLSIKDACAIKPIHLPCHCHPHY